MRGVWGVLAAVILSVSASRESSGDEGTVDYSDHLLISLSRVDAASRELLQAQEGLDEWSMDPVAGTAVYRLPHSLLASLKRSLAGTRARINVKHKNVQQLIDNEIEAMRLKSADWFGSYHPLAEITQFFDRLVQDNPELTKKVDKIGESFEGRPIFAVHFTANNRKERDESASCRREARRPNKIWVQCLIHAREWVSGSTCQFLAQEILSGYKKGDPAYTELLDNNEIIMVPVVNPDGYEHTWKRDRLWRKNRHPFRFGTGVDLNRNFADEHWCRAGASNVPFADTYCGPSAGSEKETKAIQSYYQRYAGRVAAAIDFHSFSKLILRPNGFSLDNSPDEDRLLEASEVMESAIKARHNETYKPIRASELYLTTGSATDYFYNLAGQHPFRPYSIALELRPSASSLSEGFLLDPASIRPCVEEVLDGFMAFVQYALEHPLTASADDLESEMIEIAPAVVSTFV